MTYLLTLLWIPFRVSPVELGFEKILFRFVRLIIMAEIELDAKQATCQSREVRILNL